MYPHLMQSPPGPRTVLDGRTYLYFAGTGYLGIQGRPELADAAILAMRELGMGPATMRTGFGNTQPTAAVESLAARFFRTESALYFASGYSSAAVVTAGLQNEVDAVFVDELSHFSVQDAVRLLGKPVTPFGHRSPDALRSELRRSLQPSQRPLVITDGVFPVSGRIAPSRDYVDVLSEFAGSVLLVDDAHAVATLGAGGRGSLEHHGLFDEQTNALSEQGRPRLLTCGTLSKAVGGFGGIVPGSRSLIERMVRGSASVFAASPPPTPTSAATARALQIVLDEPELIERLHTNVAHLKAGLKGLGVAIDPTPVPIIPVELESADRMRAVQQQLMDRGIAIAFSQGYSGIGPLGALRIAVFATHTEAMIDELLAALAKTL